MSKTEKEAAGGKATASDADSSTTTLTPAPQPARSGEVQYVVNRPYSAGEMPEIIPARIKKQDDADPNILDLAIPGPDGKEETVKGVRRSDRQEPGTWFELKGGE